MVRVQWIVRARRWLVICGLAIVTFAVGGLEGGGSTAFGSDDPTGVPAPEAEASSAPARTLDEFLQAFKSGKPLISIRLRAEVADATGSKRSQAFTSRLALGYETAEFHGFKLLAEVEDVRSIDESLYNAAGLNGEPRRTAIADPESTEVNRLNIAYSRPKFEVMFRVGRQNILLDDHRFVGNVGWRQNHQTFDAAHARYQPTDHWDLKYYYVWDAHRIFGDNTSAAAPNQRRDFESDSHLFNASFTKIREAKLTVFAYFLDFGGANTTAPANSSSTYGVRVAGDSDISDNLTAGYVGSYAYQVDGEDNPTGYQANYFHVAGWIDESSLGKVNVGYEHLGSHHGRAQFRTPLATAHKFNGWADSFLDNGGTSGLVDVYVGVSPKIPGELKGSVIYHKFNTAEGGGDLGWEIDAALSKQIRPGLTALTKFAYFEGPRDADLYRYWLEIAYKF